MPVSRLILPQKLHMKHTVYAHILRQVQFVRGPTALTTLKGTIHLGISLGLLVPSSVCLYSARSAHQLSTSAPCALAHNTFSDAAEPFPSSA